MSLVRKTDRLIYLIPLALQPFTEISGRNLHYFALQPLTSAMASLQILLPRSRLFSGIEGGPQSGKKQGPDNRPSLSKVSVFTNLNPGRRKVGHFRRFRRAAAAAGDCSQDHR
jgi:hypothetical protein